MTQSDPILDEFNAAVQQGRTGDRAAARQRLEALWDEIGDAPDAFHCCVIAHYVADLQDTVEAELMWDERALDAVSGISTDRAKAVHESLDPRGFLPSLHLNLADAHRRLGNPGQARVHVDAAYESIHMLADDAYGASIRDALRRTADALDALPARRPGVAEQSSPNGMTAHSD